MQGQAPLGFVRFGDAMSNELSNPVFRDEARARKWLEDHLWPDGPVCGHCGTVDNATAIETRPGWYQCNATECRSQFTVTVGTLFERSHIPLTKWLMAAFLICASKKGMSALQLSRMLGVSYKSTWFMMHRMREAMRDGQLGPIGGQNKVVEADETVVGGKAKNRAYAPGAEEAPCHVAGRARRRSPFLPHQGRDRQDASPRQRARSANRKSYLMTDERQAYIKLGPRVFRPRHGQPLRRASTRGSAISSTPTRSRAISRSSSAA